MSHRLLVAPPNAPPFEHVLDGGEVVIGRARTAGLMVPDASVSRHHARLFERDGRWWAEDLAARNGTLLNGVPLSEATPLGDGDRLQMGGTTLTYATTAAAARVEAAGAAAVTDSALVPGDRQAARLQTINAVHRALATPIALADLLDLILDRCFDVLRPEEGMILLGGPDGDWRPVATKRSARATGEMFVSRRLAEEVAGRGRPVLVLDAALDERFADAKSVAMSGVKSVLAAPLADADGSLGMVVLASRVAVRRFAEDDLDMLVSIASAAALRVRNVALAEEAAARRVLERELALAHDMQMAMLPRRLPAHPAIDLAAHLTPARSVGGDLYDFVEDGTRLWFIVADVAGKGVAAALVTAVVKTLFRAGVRGETDLTRLVSLMNAELCRDNDHLVFVTAIVGCLDLDTGRIAVGDVGHNPALLVRADGRVTAPELPKCIALGVQDDATFTCGGLTLESSDALVLYTDGVTDARRPDGTMFGDARLQAALEGAGGATAAAVLARLQTAVDRFSDGAPPEDDLTILVLRYRVR